MSGNEFTGPRDSSAHGEIVWDYIKSLPDREIENIAFGVTRSAISEERAQLAADLHARVLPDLRRAAVHRDDLIVL